MDFKVCKDEGFDYDVKGQKNGETVKDIPQCPQTATFSMASSEDSLKVWVVERTAPGDTPWKFKYIPTAPQSVTVSIGEN